MNLRSATLLLSALPLALAISACDKKADTAAATNGDAIAKVAAPAGKSWADTVTKTADGGYLMGNPNAPIKLMEVGALSCSHCAEFSEAASAEMRDNFVASGRVSFELRLHMNNALDVPAALLATCGPVEATIPLADQFWANQKAMFATLQQNEAIYASCRKATAGTAFCHHRQGGRDGRILRRTRAGGGSGQDLSGRRGQGHGAGRRDRQGRQGSRTSLARPRSSSTAASWK